jgi:hypothetical protein
VNIFSKPYNDCTTPHYIDDWRLPVVQYNHGSKNIRVNKMDTQITQQNREHAAQQLRQWALSRNVSLVQTEQMVMAVRSGQYDAQLLQARTTVRNPTPSYQHQQQHQQQQQHHAFANPPLFFSFQTPFGTFPQPTMPQQTIQTISGTNLPPANFVPNMFPTPSVQVNSQVPETQTTRTTFPGGEAIQQNSSYAGQQGNTTFQYSSSSTPMNVTPGAQLPSQWSMQYIHQPALPLPTIPQVQAAPTYIAMPIPAHPQPQHQPQHYETRSSSSSYMTLNAGSTPVVEQIPTPEQVFNPSAANQAPQKTRLADRFKQELTEATYFSDIPGMPDQEVRR